METAGDLGQPAADDAHRYAAAIVVTTTPRPTRLIRDLVAREGTDGIVITRGSTYENREHLAPSFFTQLVRRFEGTRAGRQELMGEVLSDVAGALWNREVIEETRVESAPALQRIVIGVDPAGSSAPGADLTGIVACGLGMDGQLYVLADLSCRGTPREWAGKALGAYHALKADKIVVERNYGGEMAASTLASVDPAVPVKEISSSRGKVLRAEPAASFWEQKRAHSRRHADRAGGSIVQLHERLGPRRDGSPDRVDALVFAVSELMLNRPLGGFFREQAFLVDGAPVPMPRRPDWVFAVAWPSPGQDALGVLFLASSPNADIAHPLTVLDYDLHTIEVDTWAVWLPQVFSRLKVLARECEARHVNLFTGRPDVALWVQSAGIGTAVLQQGQERGLHVFNIDEISTCPRASIERVADVSAWISGGAVKIAAGAHERVMTRQAVCAIT